MTTENMTQTFQTPATDTGTPAQTVQAPATQQADQAFLIVGERAFTDKAAAAKHISSAQSHIATLEAERKADRVKLGEQEAELARLRLVAQSIENGVTPSIDDRNMTTPINREELINETVKAVTGVLTAGEKAKIADSNMALSFAASKAAYGEKHVEKVAEIARNRGMSTGQIDDLARTAPEAFKALFLPIQTGSSVPFNNGINTNALSDSGTNKPSINVMKMTGAQRAAFIAERIKA